MTFYKGALVERLDGNKKLVGIMTDAFLKDIHRQIEALKGHPDADDLSYNGLR